VEGGGDRYSRAQLRRGFKKGILKEPVTLGEAKGVRLDVVACGSIESTYEDFRVAVRTNPTEINLLLVDSDAPVRHIPREHLSRRNRRWNLGNIADEHCHLMVQVMEAWIVADIQALEDYYGRGLNSKRIPRTTDVEQIGKDDLERSLKAATRSSQKGEYSKTKHAPELLERLDASRVRSAARHCDRFLGVLEKLVNKERTARSKVRQLLPK
jgi:hypothetical protein